MRLLVKAPCCSSVRTCRDTVKYVIDTKTKEVIAEIPAVRCYRGLQKIYEIEVAEEKMNDIVVVKHYVSNRGVHRLYFEHLKEPPADVINIVKEILGLTEVRKIVVR